MKRRLPFAILLASFVMVSPGTIRADELKLKDGTKIVGTIVGFEENSFRVKTNYGFAVVQKDPDRERCHGSSPFDFHAGRRASAR